MREDVEKNLDVVFEDLGSQMFKNIAGSIHVFGIDLETKAGASDTTKQNHPIRNIHVDRFKNRKASLAVLPFNIFGHDDQSEFLADGLVEDILTALARFRLVSIIARNSTFAYRGQGVDVRRAGIELGATYILEGSVRRSGDTVRCRTPPVRLQTL